MENKPKWTETTAKNTRGYYGFVCNMKSAGVEKGIRSTQLAYKILKLSDCSDRCDTAMVICESACGVSYQPCAAGLSRTFHCIDIAWIVTAHQGHGDWKLHVSRGMWSPPPGFCYQIWQGKWWWEAEHQLRSVDWNSMAWHGMARADESFPWKSFAKELRNEPQFTPVYSRFQTTSLRLSKIHNFLQGQEWPTLLNT